MLKDKVALITGANRGIGREILEKFSEEGAIIYAHSRKKNLEFEDFCLELGRVNQTKIIPIYFDLSDTLGIARYLENVSHTIDILVNNAGIYMDTPFQSLIPDQIERLFRVNYYAPVFLSQSIANNLISQKRQGTIINISSNSAFLNIEKSSAYSASKAALVSSTKIMAKELAPYGIRVNSISPGATSTDMWDTLNEQLKEKTLASISLNEVPSPEDIAEAVCFFASDSSKMITGQVLRVDGGVL